jgi:hypothetical protein
MSLNYDITNCNNVESIKTESEWYKTEHMIFATMAIDMHEITEDNVCEFYARLMMVAHISEGAWYTAGIGWEMPTFEDIQKRIGIHTNAYSRNTFNQWLKRIANCYPEYSKDKMLANYYTAKVEATEAMNKEKVGA